MDNYKNELRIKEERNGGLVNLITNYAIENQMSAKDVDECVEIVKEVFYSDGLVRRSQTESDLTTCSEISNETINKEIVIRDLKTVLRTNKELCAYQKESVEYAIKELEKAAPEVPVQEQLIEVKIDGKTVASSILGTLDS